MKSQIKKTIIGILFFTLIISQIYSITVNDYDYLQINMQNEISFSIKKEPDFKINSFEVISNIFPANYKDMQYLNKFDSSHDNYHINDNSGNIELIFNFDENTIDENNFIQNTFTIESIKSKPQIIKKEQYPINNVNEENKIYLEFADLIDKDENIMKKASQLAENKDDVYVIAVDIAHWVEKNIKYDLSTITLNPDQKSSQVIVSKAGVCKELTNLYVSMMRSLGIPSKVVSGYAYTDSQELIDYVGSNWGGHAWAEVFINDEWVPFDLTYKQYGFVDATHLVINKDISTNENSISIKANGQGFEFVANSLKNENQFTIIEKKNINYEKEFGIEITGPQEISPQSYGYIKVNIENKKKYYQAINIYLAKAKEIELVGDENKVVVLKPLEKKELYYKYYIPQLDKGYIYTFPFMVKVNDDEIDFEIKVRHNSQTISIDELPNEEEPQINKTNNNIILNCTGYFDLPQNLITCHIRNVNNYEIENLQICIQNNICKDFTLRLNEEKEINFKTPLFNEIIDYKYENKKEKINIIIKKPSINYTYKTQDANLKLNYEIKNFINKSKLEIYINGKKVNETSFENSTMHLKLNERLNKITLKLLYGNTIIEEQEFVIEKSQNELLDLENQNKKNFFEKIINWIMKLFQN